MRTCNIFDSSYNILTTHKYNISALRMYNNFCICLTSQLSMTRNFACVLLRAIILGASLRSQNICQRALARYYLALPKHLRACSRAHLWRPHVLLSRASSRRKLMGPYVLLSRACTNLAQLIVNVLDNLSVYGYGSQNP